MRTVNAKTIWWPYLYTPSPIYIDTWLNISERLSAEQNLSHNSKVRKREQKVLIWFKWKNWKHISFQVSFAAGHGERRNPPSRLQGIEKNMKFLSWYLLVISTCESSAYERSRFFVTPNPPGILSRGKCVERIVKEDKRSCQPWNSADNFESKNYPYVKIHLFNKHLP